MRITSGGQRWLALFFFCCSSAWTWPCQADDNEQLFAPAAAVIGQRCLRCHNRVELKGDLALEQRQVVADANVIVAGDPGNSLLLQAVSPQGGQPPAMPREAPPLTPEETTAIRNWIAAGAPWPKGAVIEAAAVRDAKWWSFAPVAHATPPTPDELRTALGAAGLDESLAASWVKTPVDAFILGQLAASGLEPSAAADSRTLVRRLYLDLIGLPPSLDELRQFENDLNPAAYERLVERLLASPRYGERWARHWLDVVHYGDTHGFDKDKVRAHAWPYRDYVIRSLNADKVYSRFAREQIAGDALYPETPDGVVATGLIAAGPFDWVGQIEVAESVEKARVRNLDRDDMVSTVMNTFASVTAQCARCHHHKFDPIPQADYYRLQAVFAGVDRANRPYREPPAAAAKREVLNAQLGEIQQAVANWRRQFEQRVGVELNSLDQQLQALSAAAPRKAEIGYHSQIEAEQDRLKWVQVDLGQETTIARVGLVGCHDDFNQIGAGFGFPPRYRVEVSHDAQFGQMATTIVDQTEFDSENPGVIPQVHAAPAGTRARFVRVTATKLAPRQNDFIFALGELAVWDDQGRNLAAGREVASLDSIEAPARWSRANLVDGYFFGAGDEDQARDVWRLSTERGRLIARALDSDSRRQGGELLQRQREIQRQVDQLPAIPLVFAAAAEFAAEGKFQPTRGIARPILVLHRGDEQHPDLEKGPLQPGALSAISNLSRHFELPGDQPEHVGRVALANWLVDPENPLTWRSIVNRLWQHHFGRGLVATPNDFGRMGATPSHPGLLDWLASEFRDHEQSWKRLHYLICTSAVYRQSSQHRPEAAQADGENRWLWRMNRRRMEAEAIRDASLSVAGQLDLRMGGPGFRSFEFLDDHSPHYKYEEYDPVDPATHRRSIYRFVVRSVPDPLMTALDFADPSLSVPDRTETLTALQALALMNDRLMVYLSEQFAAGARSRADDLPTQAARAFETALCRPPSADELGALVALGEKHGLSYVCRMILNLNEFIFVD